MNKYKRIRFVEEKTSLVKTIDDKKYHRYMDNIYIPEESYNLSISDVIELSEFRSMYSSQLVDYDYTESIIEYLIKQVSKANQSKMIDFGCGFGILYNVLSEKKNNVKEITCLDCSKYSLKIAENNFKMLKTVKSRFYSFSEKDKINLPDNSVGSIISSFVMHFKIYENQIKELSRVLKVGGQFVYNDYKNKNNPIETLEKIKILEKNGFEIEKKDVYFSQEKEKHHKIIIATKVK